MSVQCVDWMLEVIPGLQWTTAFSSIFIQTAGFYELPLDVTITSNVWCRVDGDPLTCYDEEHGVRGLAPETQVGLSRYLVTIKLCDSYCLGIGIDELVAWQLSSCTMTAGGICCITTAFGSIYIWTTVMMCVEWMRIHSTFDDEKRVPSSSSTVQGASSACLAPLCLLSCVDSFDTAPSPCYPACLAPLCLLSGVDSFDTAPPPQDLLAGFLYTAPSPLTGDGSFDSCLSSP
ncbi:uncharacterized protein UHO2_06802 [Ustilago hordei]|uniref:uncharacterized protein n=1 Tax=Ustilago hordei TaxID=120017 RepID=UPI001A4C4F09|nr:uncharacterized protein UHO2_06802 [Ustilago hordei]SYW83588.1 uncharacterized protein UHO2_06802 [Ustilago hordei]